MQQITFQSLLFKGINRHGELPAITLLPSKETLTYKELLEKTELISYYLLQLGVGRGSHVAALIPNSLESVTFGLAIQQLGATLVPLNEKLGKQEIHFILQEARPKVVIMATQPHIEPILEYLEESNDAGVHIVGLPGFDVNYPDKFKLFQWPDGHKDLDLPVAMAGDLAVLSYTGGTTGNPKGVMHSQEGLGAAQR